MEQAGHEPFQFRAARVEQPRDAPGIAVKAGHILPGEVEQHADIFVLVFGDVEDLAEGADLVAGDLAVSLG